MAINCRQMIQTIGPGLVEYGALLGAMLNFETRVAMETQVWDEFQVRFEGRENALPTEAIINLFAIAELAARLIDVLDSKNYVIRKDSGGALFLPSENVVPVD